MDIGSGGFRELEMLRPPSTQGPESPRATPETTGADAPGAPSFGEALEGAMNAVEEANQSADVAAVDYVTGENGDLHNVVMQMERADLTFQTMLQVRNKLLDAYREIMRMQV